MKEQLTRFIQYSGVEFDWRNFHPVQDHSIDRLLSEVNPLFSDPLFDVSLHRGELKDLHHAPDTFLIKQGQDWHFARRLEDAYLLDDQTRVEEGFEQGSEVIYLKEVPKKLSVADVLLVLMGFFPRINGLLLFCAPFALIPAFYANLFNTRLIHNDVVYTLLFLTLCFTVLWGGEFLLKKWVKFQHIRHTEKKALKVEKYLFALLPFSQLPDNLVKVRQIESNRRGIWDNGANLIADIAIFCLAYGVLAAILGLASVYLLLFYLVMAVILLWVRYRNYKTYIEHEAAQQEMLTERISVCRNAQQLRFYDFEPSFAQFEAASNHIFLADKRIAHVNFNWDELVRYSSFLASFCLFVVLFYQAKVDVAIFSVLIALLVLNGRLAAALSASVTKGFQLLIARYHLQQSLEPLLKSIADNCYNKGANIDQINNIEVKSVSINVGEEPLLTKVNLSLKKGETYGIMGGVGSGKSTLVKALVSMHESYQGSILFNRLYEANTLDRHVLADCVGYLDMNSQFMRGSLFHNFFIRGVRDKELIIRLVRSVFPQVNLDYEMLYKTDIHSIPMSSGQRRKLQLYMTVTPTKSLLVLDEALTNLSLEEMMQVRKYIAVTAPNAIVLIVSHDRILLSSFKNLIKIDKGTVSQLKNTPVTTGEGKPKE
ncbi:ATP-binding cassette domain-containing protein [Rhodanobacter aciditrophus]|uniref:ATP-binding cassette domain-containing protein n=2 Tax=Bacteria TaxID=2 RepID=A0ABW4B4H5_9GAMM